MIQTVSAIKYKNEKVSIQHAYKAFIDKQPGAEGELLSLLLTFARKKITHSTYHLDETSNTEDDFAQISVLEIWNKINNVTFVTVEPSQFYGWINRTFYYRGIDAYNSQMDEQLKKEPLMVESDVEQGEIRDNPKLRIDRGESYTIRLPDYITGLDRFICRQIESGLTYPQIAKGHGMKLNTIKKRVERIRKKVEQEKAKQKGIK